jgi:hypothetical protein
MNYNKSTLSDSDYIPAQIAVLENGLFRSGSFTEPNLGTTTPHLNWPIHQMLLNSRFLLGSVVKIPY